MLKDKTIVFIDASNIIYGAFAYGWKVDFRKLIAYLNNRFGAKDVRYFAGLDAENKKQIAFYEKLTEFGYKLRLVPVKKFADGRKKADVDSRLTFEIMRDISKFTQAVILTGDGDYFWVLAYLLSKKRKKVILLSFAKRTARELKKLVGEQFTDISRLKRFISLKATKKR